MTSTRQRPAGVAALAVLFAFGTLASAFALVTLAWPGTVLDAIWRINPDGHAALSDLGRAGGWLMGVVCASCAAAAYGTWNGRRWGYLLAILLLVGNLCGAVADAIVASRPQALIGVPIVVGIMVYLRLSTARAYFQRGSRLRSSG
jgi:hypothetical protein